MDSGGFVENLDHTQMFKNLMHLCENPDLGFYFVDDVYTDDHTYRTFSYRLVGSYNMWLLPDALNCRGTMFRKNKTTNGWDLVCLPMPKCFRLGENPIIMEQQKTFDKLSLFTKHDGSLISTFIDANGNLGVKSKTSLKSPHAKLAKQYISDALVELVERYNNIPGYLDLWDLKNNTISFELTSDDPELRIVLKYEETKLQPLNVRSMGDGKVRSFNQLRWCVPTVDSLIKHCETETGVEGYVVHDSHNDVYFKIKTGWYDTLHSSKFSFSEENVVRMILEESIDDYISIHSDDIGMKNKINKIVERTVPVYNHLMQKVETFYRDNQHLTKRDYAILGQKELKGMEFTLAINLFTKKCDSKQHTIDLLMKHWKDIFSQPTKEIVIDE